MTFPVLIKTPASGYWSKIPLGTNTGVKMVKDYFGKHPFIYNPE
jgi:hypothetical protein